MSMLPTAPQILHGLPQDMQACRATRYSDEHSKHNLVKRQSRESLISPLIRLARNPVGALGTVLDGLRDGADNDERARTLAVNERKEILNVLLANASTYEEWRSCAEELDVLEGIEEWKAEPSSADYDAILVESRLKALDEARISCDVKRMLFLLRTSLTRELGGMGNVRLYRHSHVGTKNLIERYITSALETIAALLQHSAARRPNELDSKYMLEQMLSARQAFGRSALMLSGGATFGMNHIGVLKTLWQNRLLPRIISGASAGSIVCSVLCTRTDEEMPELIEQFPHGDLSVFEESGQEEGVLMRVARFLKRGAWIDTSHLMRVMKNILGDMTFQESYNRTRRILNICVSSASLYELPRLLNYITAPNVLIWSAVAASCSVPFVFTSASLLAKDPKTGEAVPWNPTPQRYIDGSVDNDLPMTRLAEMFNVNHFIVSQVNPHVIPFLEKEDEVYSPLASAASSGQSWGYTMMNLAKAEAMHRMHILADFGIFPNTLTKARSVLSQKYSGDITIFPEISYADFPRMLKNPTSQFMLRAMLSGERATWPKMSRIRNHCAIELALDDAVQRLRARVVFSPSQVDLRLNAFSGKRNILTITNANLAAAQTRNYRGRRRWGSQNGDSDGPNVSNSSKPRAHHTRSSSTRVLETCLPHLPPTSIRHRPSPVLPTLQIPSHADLISSGAESTHSPVTSATSPSTTSTSSTTSPTIFAVPHLMTSEQPLSTVSQPSTPKAKSNWNLSRCPSPALTGPERTGLGLTMTRTSDNEQTGDPYARRRSFPWNQRVEGTTEAGQSQQTRVDDIGGDPPTPH
ncbi:MAG: hypothetical protein M1825_005231 [Sarcosagium campestre]|nr:MAG: hypothetical protein M1825_005231 [Sarcosagium campestre]